MGIKIDEISSRNALADLLGVPRNTISYLLYKIGIDNCYFSFSIPKRSGGERTICSPNKQLKALQRSLLFVLNNYYYNEKGNRNPASFGFEKGKSFIQNADSHKYKRFILNLDIEDFFGSFNFGRVRGFFIVNRCFRLDPTVATTIAQITCCNGVLPQGAPTSPAITNMICQVLDYHLIKIARKYNLHYTRYADDMTFSTNDKRFPEHASSALQKIEREIKNAGFSINVSKTRLMYCSSQQKVTGLVVNTPIINVDKNYYKETRAMAHSLFSTGEFKIRGEKGTVNQLEGRFSYIYQLIDYNVQKGRLILNRDSARIETIRQFLFYKLFFSLRKPLLISEGNTDPIYIKAALKNLYSAFPDLVKLEGGCYVYQLCFLKRNRRFKEIFGVSDRGADALVSFYSKYCNMKEMSSQNGSNQMKGKEKDYISLFHNHFHIPFSYPVILLFDNEVSNEKKPLGKFVNCLKLSKETIADELRKNGYFKIHNDCNIYCVATPLVREKTECEIEDLFDKETLEVKIKGKSFSRKPEPAGNESFGKEEFAKYIYSNFQSIDFSNFKELFNSILSVIEDFKNTNQKNC